MNGSTSLRSFCWRQVNFSHGYCPVVHCGASNGRILLTVGVQLCLFEPNQCTVVKTLKRLVGEAGMRPTRRNDASSNTPKLLGQPEGAHAVDADRKLSQFLV